MPSLPDGWEDASFHKLRAEGAFLVSALWRRNQIAYVRLESLAGEPCRVQLHGTSLRQSAGSRAFMRTSVPGGIERIDLRRGEFIALSNGHEKIMPAPTQPGRENWFGESKATDRLPHRA